MKKILSLFLAVVLAASFASVSFAQGEVQHIVFWHTRGSGAQLQAVENAVNAFNATVGKEKGIEVEQTYIGNYETLLTKLQLQTQAGGMPEIAVVGATSCVPVYNDGLLVDMTPYAERDSFDLNNLVDVFHEAFSVYEDKLISLPYIRSTPVLVYNKTMADAAGLSAPTTEAELENFARTLTVVNAQTKETDVYGLQIHSDFVFFMAGILENLGGSFLSEDGMGCPALESGAMLSMLSTWRRWVDEGICQPFAATNAASVEKEAFLQGRLACFYQSCGGVGDLLKKSREAGFEMGVAMLPGWNGQSALASTGGGNVVIPAGDNTQEEIDAAWEFVKFLMSDEMVADNAIVSGYLPVTKSVATNETMTSFWAETPQYKVAYDQLLSHAFNVPMSEYYVDLKTACSVAVSMLIQEQSITPEEAVEAIKDEASAFFN